MSLVIDVPPGSVTMLLAPIEPELPAGHFDVEDETYQAIDQEMVKLGGCARSASTGLISTRPPGNTWAPSASIFAFSGTCKPCGCGLDTGRSGPMPSACWRA